MVVAIISRSVVVSVVIIKAFQLSE